MLGYKLDHRRFKQYFLGAIGATVMVTFCNLAASMVPYLSNAHSFWDWIYLLTIIVLSSAWLTLMFLYSYFLLNIQLRFRLLNVTLSNALAPSNVFTAKSSKIIMYDDGASETVASLNRLSIYHNQLTTAVDIFNRSFSFQVRSIFEFSFWMTQ